MHGFLSASVLLISAGYSQGYSVQCNGFTYCDDTWYCCHFDKCCKLGYSSYVEAHSGDYDDDDTIWILILVVIAPIVGLVILTCVCVRVIKHYKRKNAVTVFRAPSSPPPAYPPMTQGRQRFGAHRDAGVGPRTNRPGQTLNVPRPGGLDGGPWKVTRPPSAFPDGMPPQHTPS